jgi:hypothetical protein
MEDDLNLSQMEDDLIFWKMEEDLHFVAIGRRPHYFSERKMTKIIWKNGRRPQSLINGR